MGDPTKKQVLVVLPRCRPIKVKLTAWYSSGTPFLFCFHCHININIFHALDHTVCIYKYYYLDKYIFHF